MDLKRNTLINYSEGENVEEGEKTEVDSIESLEQEMKEMFKELAKFDLEIQSSLKFE